MKTSPGPSVRETEGSDREAGHPGDRSPSGCTTVPSVPAEETSSRPDPSLAEALAALIRFHRQRYDAGTPEITDAEFDALEDRLRTLAPEHPALTEVGAPPGETGENARATPPDEDGENARASSTDEDRENARASSAGEDEEDARTSPLLPVDRSTARLAEGLKAEAARAYAGQTVDPRSYEARFIALEQRAPDHAALARVPPPQGRDWPKQSHEIPMGSLNKVNTDDELEDWVKRCDELAKKAEIAPIRNELAVTEKLDGLAIEVVYDGGRVDVAITRGDGRVGERITPNVLRMKGLPARIAHRGRLSVRGEIVLRKSDAPRVEAFKQKVDKRFERLKSLRNTAAGIARTKDLKLLPACPMLSVFFYGLEGLELPTAEEELAFLAAQGFATPSGRFTDVSGVRELHEAYQQGTRDALDYDIDGLVVRANRNESYTLLGELNHRPRAAVAFKFGNEMQVTLLKAILWSTGDSGRITPIARIEPVFLAGAEVRQASLHNLAKVQAMHIGVGDEVLVSRRGDVIPYVEDVVIDGGSEEVAPETCAACHEPVVVDGEYLLCVNVDCPARRLGRLKTWVRHLGLLEWGEKTFIRLMGAGLVDEPADLYRLRAEEIASIEGYGDVSAKKLLAPLRAKMEIPITTFIACLGIQSVSRETAKMLIAAGYDTFDAIMGASIDALAQVEGLGTIKAEKIIRGISDRRDEIARLAGVGVVPVRPAEGGPLAGLSFCFSGSQNRPRQVLHALVEKNGGTVRASVTKGLSYLVLADPASTSSKAQKARKLGTEIIDGDTFEALVRQKGGRLT